MKKTILSIFLVVLVFLCSMPAFATENSDFTIENGVLTKYNGSGGDVTIPEGVTSVGIDVFGSPANLTSVTFPSSVTNIISDTFGFQSELTKFIVDPKNAVYSSLDGVLYSKDKTVLVCCPGSRPGTFTIPKGVKVIGGNAFVGCIKLTSITIPNGVTSIQLLAFQRCLELTNITIPNSVTSIGNGAFTSCTKLSNIIIPRNVTSMGENLFDASQNVTISGYDGSVAQTYAEKNNIPFRSLDAKQVTSTVQNGSAVTNKLSSSTAPANSLNATAINSASSTLSFGTESEISSENSSDNSAISSAVSAVSAVPTGTVATSASSMWLMVFLVLSVIIIVGIIIFVLRKKRDVQTPSSQKSDVLHCPNCGSECEAGTKFCEQCGQSIKDISIPKSLICSKYGFENDLDAKFCMGCGNKLNKD